MTTPEHHYTVDIEHGAAVMRVFRRPDLDPVAMVRAWSSLLDEARGLTEHADVRGLVLDIRRLTGAASPEVEAVFRTIATAWEASGQAVAFLSIDPMQRLQIQRIVNTAAPRMGAVFEDRNDARRFVGASSIDPETSSLDVLALVRGTKTR